jgi:translation elongation factor EF-Ts
MHTNHLASMRTVEAYIHQKRRQKVLAALKQQINESRTKMDMNRAACKFRLFRYTLLLKATTFRALK